MANRRRTTRKGNASEKGPPRVAAGGHGGSQPAASADNAPDTPGPRGRAGRRWRRITPTRLDRLLVIWIATALGVWLCCLVMLWSWALDPSGATTLAALSATLLAIAGGMLVLHPLGGASRRVLQWLRLQDVLAIDATVEGGWIGREDLLGITRLLGSVAVFAGLCGLLSTAAVLAGKAVVDWLTRRLLWTPLTWAVLKFAVQLVGMAPIGLGVATAFRASSMVRSGSGRDPYAAVCREWLAAGGLAMLIFGGLWLAGAGVLGVALMTGVVLVAAAVVLFQRPKEQRRPRRVTRTAGSPRWKSYASVGAVFAGVGIGLAVQVRLVGDATGAGPVGSALWAAGSALLLARLLGVEDRRSRPAGRGQAMGSAIGAVGAVLAQGVLAMSSLAVRREGRFSAGAGLLVLAAAVQIPAAALVAVTISRGRTLFARAGGSVKAYAACACGAAGLGVGVGRPARGRTGGQMVVLAAAAAAVLGCAAGGAYMVRQGRKRLQWVTCGAALICALGAGLIGSMRAAGPVTLGTWLTSAGRSDGSRGDTPIGGVIPSGAWQSEGVTAALAQVLSKADLHGRWWVVSPSGRELPQPPPAGIWWTASSADPGMAPPGAWRRKVRAAEADFLAQTRIGRERLDGVLLAPLPADHPQAWRCYNELTLMRCRQRLHGRGVMLLRTQVSRGRVSKAISVAKTFHGVVGSGWAVLAFGDSTVDVLLVGPGRIVAQPRGSSGALVVNIERLIQRAPEAPPVRLVHPEALWSGRRVDTDQLEAWLRSAGSQ